MAAGGVPTARLARRPDDREPLPVLARRNGRAGHRAERQRIAGGAPVEQLLLVHVSAKNECGARRLHAVLRLPRPGDIRPALRRCSTGMNEQDVVVPDGERQAVQEGALPAAELRLRPGDRLLRGGVEAADGLTDCCSVVVAEHHDRALRRVLLDQVQHGDRVGPIADQIAEERVALGSKRLGVLEASAERFQVAVNVGEQSQLHSHPAAPRFNSPPDHFTVSLILSTTSGLASVDTSPVSWWFEIAASTRRMILPERVLGMSGTMITWRGLAIAPISETTDAETFLASSSEGLRPGLNAT